VTARPYGRHAPQPPNRLKKLMFVLIGLVIAPSIAVGAIGLGLVVGVLLAWISRGLTKL